MMFYLKSFPYRLIFSIAIIILVYFTPTLITNFADIPAQYTAIVFVLFPLHQVSKSENTSNELKTLQSSQLILIQLHQ
jgi:hypothetical protein